MVTGEERDEDWIFRKKSIIEIWRKQPNSSMSCALQDRIGNYIFGNLQKSEWFPKRKCEWYVYEILVLVRLRLVKWSTIQKGRNSRNPVFITSLVLDDD